ncbi:MAG: dTMP kinase [Flavobacteriaceae bacterium]
MRSGTFITFEGGEGTGKSTQARRLADYLEAHGAKVLLTREPGGTPSGEIVRRIVLAGAAEPLGPLAEAVLMNAARSDHLEMIIRPALKAGKTVICDRFSDSTLAYQGFVGGVDLKLLRQMEAVIVGDTVPDLTFVMDAPVPQTLSRARRETLKTAGKNATPDRFEKQDKSIHEEIRKAFLALALQAPRRMRVIDATGTPDEVFARIVRNYEKLSERAA